MIKENSMNNMTKEQKEPDFEKESIYLDSNCFIYSSLNKEEIGKNAKKILERIKNGAWKKAYTSTLTVDEFLWKVQKEVGRELAAEGTSIFFSLENLELINIDSLIISQAIEIYKKNKLDPRDAIHLAAMQSKKIKTIYSSDSDFDKIKEIKRIDFRK